MTEEERQIQFRLVSEDDKANWTLVSDELQAAVPDFLTITPSDICRYALATAAEVIRIQYQDS